jgi:hypothetical protein
MLFSIDGRLQTTVPHHQEYEMWLAQLTAEEIQAIHDRLDVDIDQKMGVGVVVSSWLPGPDWEGTPYFPIWDTACRRNDEHSALFFGLLVWRRMMDRPEDWRFIKDPRDAGSVRGMKYFIMSDRGDIEN